MKSSRGSMLLQSALLALAVLGLGYWAWQRYHRPPAPTYDGKTLDQWIEDLEDPDYRVSDRAAEVLVQAGAEAVPVLIDARERGDMRLYRRAAAALWRIGAPAAPGLVAALKDKPKAQRSDVVLVRLGPAAVPALRDALQEERGGEAAAHILGLIGPPAAEAAPDLIALLQRRQAPPALRGEAAFALGHIGERDRRDAGPTRDIVPALIAALTDNKSKVRRQAAAALGWIGPPARKAVPALIDALQDDKAAVVKKACQALVFIGDSRAAPTLLEVFRGDREEVRAAVGRALWRLGAKAEQVMPDLLSLAQGPLDKTVPPRVLLAAFGPRAVPLLKTALHADKAVRRETAAEVLGRIGPPARAAVPDLRKALQDPSSKVALTAAMALAEVDSTQARPAVPLLADSLDVLGAAHALANIGPDARSAVPALIAALKSSKKTAHSDVIRASAKLALARIGPPAVPALIAALKDQREGVAPLVAEALGWLLPPAKEAVPALRQALQTDRAHAAVYARALGQLGPLARPAVAELTEVLKDAAARPEAALALAHIDPEQAKKVVPRLVKDLQAEKDEQRQAAVLALAQLGPSAQTGAAALVKSLHDRQLAEEKLLALRDIGAAALPSLVGLLKAPNTESRRLAVVLLGQLGPAARSALPELIAALSDRDSGVRAGAAQALQAIGREASEAVPVLIANLQTYAPQVRYEAALALGEIGPKAKEAWRPLVECLFDPDENVRYAAALSVGRIDPDFAEAVPALRDACNDAAPMVQLAAIDSLRRIDRARRKDSVPLLMALSAKPNELKVRFRAVEGLGLFAPEEAKQLVPWLRVELSDADPESCLYAARVLANIDAGQTSTIVLALAAALRSPLPKDRRLILLTLAEFGPKARPAVPVIERLLQDGAPGMREQAIRALRAINPARAKQLGVG